MRISAVEEGRRVIKAISLAVLVINHAVGAQSPGAMGYLTAGYLLDARQTTVNDAVAAKGLVVLSRSRVRTSPQGFAAISLGKNGQLALAHSANFLLNYSPSRVGGRLDSGGALVSVPAGVTVNLDTAHAAITADGKKGANIVVVVSEGQTRVIALDTEAKVFTKVGVRTLTAGEAVNIDEQGPQFRCSRLPVSNVQSGKMTKGQLIALLAGGLATLGVIISTTTSSGSGTPPIANSPGPVSPVRF